MLTGPVSAGTVLYCNFNEFGLAKPEMTGAHPVLVLTPKYKQAGGMLVVVPITSEIGNFNNPDAIEITHGGLVAASPTKRSFVICDKPIALSWKRLDHFVARPQPGRNYQPQFKIRGIELEIARLAVLRAISPDSEFKSLLSDEHPDLPKEIRLRNAKSRGLGRVRRPLLAGLARLRRLRAANRPEPGRSALKEPVSAGAVYYFDFTTLDLVDPEIEGAHPVLVLPPKYKQSGGTAVVVPLTWGEGDSDNPDAIELIHKGLAAVSPTGRIFARGDHPFALSLSRLDQYAAKKRAGRNRRPSYRVVGDELQTIRLAVMRAFSPDGDFNNYLKNAHPDLPKRIRARNSDSISLGRVNGPLLEGPMQLQRKTTISRSKQPAV